MTISWYSIAISLDNGGGGPIFNGYISVQNDLVTAMYETINGSTDFNNNIYVNNNDYGADSVFINYNFTQGGTNINYMDYYSNPNSPNYFSGYFAFNICSIPYSYIFKPNPESSVLMTGYNNRVYLNGEDEVDTIYDIQSISDPSCFNEGTKILGLINNVEEYIPIEHLKKGDLVKSYKHGYRKIDLIGKNPMINNPDRFNECMYKMEKTDENGLIEDLIVTGGHSILVDDLGNYKEKNDELFGGIHKIDDKYLLLASVSNDFIKLETTNVYTYYHFILENNGNDDERFGIWANGILTETPSKNQFINHKYTLMYNQ
jgi:hypothetical protein